MSSTVAVWAPRPRRVELVLDGRVVPLERLASDWWVADVDAAPGSRYGFALDGGPALADPRSPSQPDGPDGLSAMVDHASYAWHDAAWGGLDVREAVIYECHVGTFSERGTFDGVVERLGDLVALGITAVELMPVASFPGRRGWGYDSVSLFAPHHPYGGPDGLKRLVDACHGQGLAVILDVVYNHVGPSGNHLAEFGPYFTDEHRTIWGEAVNFEGQGSHEVRRFVVDNACAWVRDYHVDGLRLDATHAIVDRSAIHVVEQLCADVGALADALGRRVAVIAESNLNDPRFVRAAELGGYGCAAAWADDWHHALHTVLTGERDGYYCDFGEFDQLGTALRQAWVYDGRYSRFRDALHGRPPDGLRGEHFVVATQTHDQVGNRARGERLCALTSPARCRCAAALLLTSPFVPMLFQGEEWAASTPFQYFTDHGDPELAASVTEGRREEFEAFGWSPEDVPDPQDPATFARSVLRWDERDEGEHAAMLEWYRALLALRREHPALRTGRLEDVKVDADVPARRLTVTRGPIDVRCNLGADTWELSGAMEVLLASDGVRSDPAGTLAIPPDGIAILRRQRSQVGAATQHLR